MKNIVPRISADLEDRLMARHKMLFTQVVMPLIAATALALVIAYWRFDAKFYAGLAIMVSLNFLNAYYSIENRRIRTPWGVVQSRSDGFDTFRWCCNLSLDVYLLWCFELSVAVAVFTWTILSIGALTEVYGRNNKLITLAFALAGFILLVFFVYPSSLTEQVYLTFTYMGLLYVLWKLELYVVAEMSSFYHEKKRREDVESKAEKLRREAAVGQSVRTISHELNNLISAGNYAVDCLQKNVGAEEISRLRKMLSYMTRVSNLALDELGDALAPIRVYLLRNLVEDLRLLACGSDFATRVPIHLDVGEIDERASFTERAGSVYFIVHNLVRNAYDAVLQQHEDPNAGRIDVSVALDSADVVVTVCDNGVGMSADRLESLRNHAIDTDKPGGHGLGLRFAKREVANNGFELTVQSELNVGTRFELRFSRS